MQNPLKNQQNTPYEESQVLIDGEQIKYDNIDSYSLKIDKRDSEEVKHPFLKTLRDFQHITQEIREKFSYMNEQLLEKPEINTNKQIQDAICKYFFHNTIGSLLKEPFKVKSIRQVNEKVFEENTYTVKLQYMKYLQCYTQQIEKFGMKEEYHNFLWNMILEDEEYTKEDQEWITELRKKMTALIALTFSELNETLNFQNMFEIWSAIYPENPLPQHFPQKKVDSHEELQENEESQDLEDVEDDIDQQKLSNNSLSNMKSLSKSSIEQQQQQAPMSPSVSEIVHNNNESSQVTDIQIQKQNQKLSNSLHLDEPQIVKKKLLKPDSSIVAHNEESTHIIDIPLLKSDSASPLKVNKVQRKKQQKINEKQQVKQIQNQFIQQEQQQQQQLNNQFYEQNLYNNNNQQQQQLQMQQQQQQQQLLMQLYEQQQQNDLQQLLQQQYQLQLQQQIYQQEDSQQQQLIQQNNMINLIQQNQITYNNDILSQANQLFNQNLLFGNMNFLAQNLMNDQNMLLMQSFQNFTNF